MLRQVPVANDQQEGMRAADFHLASVRFDAGILLGPTVLGRIPDFTDKVFPQRSTTNPDLTLQSVDTFSVVAQIGLIFFMFLMGLVSWVQMMAIRGFSTFHLMYDSFSWEIYFSCLRVHSVSSSKQEFDVEEVRPHWKAALPISGLTITDFHVLNGFSNLMRPFFFLLQSPPSSRPSSLVSRARSGGST